MGSQQAVRMGNWKGMRSGTLGRIELFDLSQDPGETKDLAGQHPDIVQQIGKIMDDSHTPNQFWPLAETVKPAKRRKPNSN